jgi:hypothetical protein
MIHLKLALGFLIFGFIFTHKLWLNWLGSLSVEAGLAVKQALILLTIYNLHYIDPSIKPYRMYSLGVYLIVLAFQIIFNYQSKWIKESGSERVEDQTPDGVLYHNARHFTDPETARLVTFVMVPVILVIIGSKFIHNGQKLNLN